MSDAEDTETETGAVEIPGEDVREVNGGSAEPGEDARPFPKEIEAPSGKEDSRRAKEGDAKDKNEARSKGLGETVGRPPAVSKCRPRSRDMRQCKKHFREMIGKYENRNDELEQRETDLRQRLDMLECSMPAVMVWNIWRMAQGAPVSQLREVVEKQFVEPGAGFGNCPSTPSQHWDCRVREIEAERKEARRRAEQARQVFRAKEEALQVQKRQVEEARKLQEERRLQIAGLEEEVKRLRDQLKKAQGDEGFCQTGECGEIKCRDAWLQGAVSASSIHSTDLECLARLQDLAEAELCMKRQIAELERRECAYMRTLQQADEMWAKMEDENASSLGELKEQLDAKVAANQQLADRIVELEDEIERLRAQLSRTSAALEEYTAKSLRDVVIEDADLPADVKIERTEDDTGEFEEAKHAEGSDEPEKPARQRSDAMVQATSEEAEQQQVGIESPSKISTAEESVQVEPEIEEAGTQLTLDEPGLESENLAEEKARVVDDADTATPEVPTEYSPEEQQEIAVIEQAQEIEAQEIELLLVQEKPRSFEDKASLAELLKAPTEDKVTEILVPENSENNSSGKNEPIEITPEAVVELTQEVIPEPAVAPVSSSAAESQPEPIVAKKVPSAAAFFEGVSKASFPTFPVHAISESSIGVTEIASPEPEAESTTEATASPVLPAAVEPVDAPTPKLETPETNVESCVKNVEEEFTLPEDTFPVSIETLVAWHNVTACIKNLISICPRCSSSSNEIENMLKEIRNLLGKDAPILSEIECPESREGAPSSGSVPQKKGPCICKPQTCPLEGKGAGVIPAAQNSVQVQTVVDGQSQTSMRSKIPSREIKSPRTSRGSTKTKEEVKLRSIEEGTETDPGIERARSIPEARDEATATVGDIASQTEGIRRIPSGADKEEKEKTCVCPTGVCPKKNPQPLSPCGECKPGKSCTTVAKKSLSKEYRSTAEAILAPAIKVLPSREGDSSSPVTRAKINNDTSSESRSACCVCGKPASPVASMKITSASTAGKSFFHSGVVSLKSEISEDDFLCCACKAQALPKSSPPGKKSSKKSVNLGQVKSRGKPTPGSCSRDVCCPCDDVEKHVITKPLNESSEVPKAKIKPETKDVCCLAKISRDKVMKTEGRRHRDKDSKSKSTTPNISVHNCSAQISATSSVFKTPKTNESSDSNFCCSSIEQVLSTIKKKKKSTKCACTSPEGKDKKDECDCGENDSPIPKEPPKIKRSESTVSCLCSPPKLFDDH